FWYLGYAAVKVRKRLYVIEPVAARVSASVAAAAAANNFDATPFSPILTIQFPFLEDSTLYPSRDRQNTRR
ncbi:hypothetical protein, partial [Adlercreutzia equolifaciens]